MRVLRRFRSSEKATQVDPLIDAVLDKMNKVGPTGSEYPEMMTYLERLYDLRNEEKPEPVKRDTVAIVTGNLVGILIIVIFERNNVMTSKAISQLMRTQK